MIILNFPLELFRNIFKSKQFIEIFNKNIQKDIKWLKFYHRMLATFMENVILNHQNLYQYSILTTRTVITLYHFKEH